MSTLTHYPDFQSVVKATPTTTSNEITKTEVYINGYIGAYLAGHITLTVFANCVANVHNVPHLPLQTKLAFAQHLVN